MQVILDHLTAILVGATLIGAMLFIQMRQQQTMVETVVRDRSVETTTSFFDVFQRELENARTREQSEAALGYFVTEVTGSDTRTDRFTFSTYEPPPPGSAPTATGNIVTVSYVLVPTGNTIRVGTADLPSYNVERWKNEVASGATATPLGFSLSGVVAKDITSFVVRAYNKDGDRLTMAQTYPGQGRGTWTTSPEKDPVRYEVEIEGASTPPDMVAGDQKATTLTNLVRVAHSIRPVNVGARGSSTNPGPSVSWREVPLLPGEPTPVIPPPGGGGGGGTGGGGGGGGGGTGTNNPPPANLPPS